MKQKTILRLIPVALMFAFLASGCMKKTGDSAQTPAPRATEQKVQANVYTGSVVGKSNKAKTISVAVGQGDDAKTMMVRFDDKTEGIEFAKKGEAAIISWEQRGDEKFATVIKPKLAKLPEGVTEIKVDELYEMVEARMPIFLADSRPEMRYDQGHLPSAVSIPVPLLKEQKAKVLPKDKNQLLVFYCGGYT